jgi:hypothetical protein
MAYRVNTRFKDGTRENFLSDVIAEPSPRHGDTIFVSRHGRDVPVLVIAVWTPLSRPPSHAPGTLVMVEAREI